MAKRGYCDLHCHVLPGMDDGCRNCEESVRLLQESVRQNVWGIAATPHYYPSETVTSFLERREAACDRLMEYLQETDADVPELCLGAEVAYRSGIAREPMLEQLCYGRSDYLLLELPFGPWRGSVLDEIEEICLVRGMVPVIAHIERYVRFQNRETLTRLFDMDILIQMNAEYYLNMRSRGRAKRLLEKGRVQVMGSDSHNMDFRPPNLGIAMARMQKKGLQDHAESIIRQNEEIFLSAIGRKSRGPIPKV